MPRSNVTAKQKLDAVKKILSGEELNLEGSNFYA